MKHSLKIFAFCIAVSSGPCLMAQYMAAPMPPAYSIVNQPGATLAQIVDTMYVRANTNDTGEGGAMDQIAAFQAYWQQRIVANDSSGTNMFDQYYSAMRTGAAERITSTGCTAGAYAGNWRGIGADSVPHQISGYVNAVWANPADSSNLLAATQGGLFKTTNGGANWSCITDKYGS